VVSGKTPAMIDECLMDKKVHKKMVLGTVNWHISALPPVCSGVAI
jgi:hypothetical protein